MAPVAVPASSVENCTVVDHGMQVVADTEAASADLAVESTGVVPDIVAGQGIVDVGDTVADLDIAAALAVADQDNIRLEAVLDTAADKSA